MHQCWEAKAPNLYSSWGEWYVVWHLFKSNIWRLLVRSAQSCLDVRTGVYAGIGLLNKFIVNVVVVFVGFLATVYQSAIQSSKSFTCWEIKAKASRKDASFDWCRCLPSDSDLILLCIIWLSIIFSWFCCRLWKPAITVLNKCCVLVAFLSTLALLKSKAVFCLPQGYFFNQLLQNGMFSILLPWYLLHVLFR